MSGALCASLGQLTGLAVVHCSLSTAAPLDSSLSQLSLLRALVCNETRLSPAACAVLRPLRSLTALHLSGCNLHGLSLGGCMRNLISLDISCNPLDGPVPFEVTAASRLRALAIDCRPDAACGEGWEELRSRLLFLRCMEELHLLDCCGCEGDTEAEALAARLRVECGCMVALNKQLSRHPVYGGLKWEDEDP
ncbi:hypothetical protein ABPG75_008553 [Micractinium tetrahymenae]